MGTFSTENIRRALFWITQVVGLIIACLTLVYIFQYTGGFGGRDYPKLEFNWHILFMVFGFTYIFGNALTVFRLVPILAKPSLKLIHLGLNGAVVICAILGLFFVIDEREIQGRAHFVSLHSWIGIFTIALLIIQFICGAVLYLSPTVPTAFKEATMPWHIKIGLSTFLLGTAAIITGFKKGTTEAERLLVNFTGTFTIIFCFLILAILTDSQYRYNYRIRC